MTNIKGRTAEAWKNEPREGHANYDQWVTSLWYDNEEWLYRERQAMFNLAEGRTPTAFHNQLRRYIRRASQHASIMEHTGVYLVKADVDSLLADLLQEYKEYVEYSTK